MLLQFCSWFWRWKNFKNRLIFDEVKAYKNDAYFCQPCVLLLQKFATDQRLVRVFDHMGVSSAFAPRTRRLYVVTTHLLFAWNSCQRRSVVMVCICRRWDVKLSERDAWHCVPNERLLVSRLILFISSHKYIKVSGLKWTLCCKTVSPEFDLHLISCWPIFWILSLVGWAVNSW